MKADATILVAAPSRHASGRSYEILDDRPPAPLPEALVRLSLRAPAGKAGLREVAGYKHRGVGGEGDGWLLVAPGRGWMDLPPALLAQADDVVWRMLRGPDAAEAAALLAGGLAANTGRDASPSGADHRLGRLAKRYTRDPYVIEAVLLGSGLARPKYDRPDYLPRTVAAVLRDDPAWLEEGRTRSVRPVGRRGVPVRCRVMGAILRRVASAPGGARDGDGLVRLPVYELAVAEGVSEDTVGRAIGDLEDLGVVVTVLTPPRRGPRGWARERRMALAVPLEAALAAVESSGRRAFGRPE